MLINGSEKSQLFGCSLSINGNDAVGAVIACFYGMSVYLRLQRVGILNNSFNLVVDIAVDDKLVGVFYSSVANIEI